VLVLQEWFADVKSVLKCSEDIARLRRLYADMSCKLIGGPRRRDSDAELYGSDTLPMTCVPGPFIGRFQQKFTKQLQELCGDDGEELVKLCKVN